MLQQLLHVLRSLRRAPTFTAAAVITLALGIGAITSVLSIVDGVLLRALPYRNVNELAVVFEQIAADNARLPSYLAFKDLQQSVSANKGGPVKGIVFLRGNGGLLRSESGVERTIGWWTSPGYFPLMGSAALHGRVFTADEERAGSNRVVVLSYRFWKKRFGGDASVVGRVLNIDSAQIGRASCRERVLQVV